RLIAEFELDAGALELPENGAERLLVADLEGEFGELMAERVHRVVAQARDLTAAFFGDGQRFQDVVHLRGVEVEARGLAGGEAAGTLEEADAVLVQHDLADGKLGG